MTKRFLVVCLALGACTSVESTGISAATCPPDSTLTYANFGSAFFTNHCLGCHDQDEKPILSTQPQILSHRPQILQQAVYSTAMPEDTDMTIAERELLGQWLACGAP